MKRLGLMTVCLAVLFACSGSHPTKVSTQAPAVVTSTTIPAAPTVAPEPPVVVTTTTTAPEVTTTTEEPTTEPTVAEETTTTTTTVLEPAPCFDKTKVVTGIDRCRPTSIFPDYDPFLPRCYEGSAPPTYIDEDDHYRQPYDGIDWMTGQPFDMCVHDPIDP